jgi:hypothetical protein
MTLSAAAVPTMRVAAQSRQIGKFGGGSTSGRPSASAAAPIPPLRRRRTLSRAAPVIFHASGGADCGERGDLNAGETGGGDDVITHASPPITSWMKRAGTGAVAFAAAAALALAPGEPFTMNTDVNLSCRPQGLNPRRLCPKPYTPSPLTPRQEFSDKKKTQNSLNPKP